MINSSVRSLAWLLTMVTVIDVQQLFSSFLLRPYFSLRSHIQHTKLFNYTRRKHKVIKLLFHSLTEVYWFDKHRGHDALRTYFCAKPSVWTSVKSSMRFVWKGTQPPFVCDSIAWIGNPLCVRAVVVPANSHFRVVRPLLTSRDSERNTGPISWVYFTRPAFNR